MNTRAVTSAAGVIHAALTQHRTSTGIALALDSAGLLNSPERAADLVELRARITELETLLAATEAPSTSAGLNERQGLLLDAIRSGGGEWTTRRVQRLYSTAGVTASKLATARRDLAALYRAGLLIEHDLLGRRHFTFAAPIGGAR